jgi:hypothetical protein
MHWLDRLVHNPLALTAKQVAYLLQKSRRWVYRNGQALGGVKVGSTWIFPKEGFYDAIQRQEKRKMAGCGQTRWPSYRPKDVQDKEGGVLLGIHDTKRTEKDQLRQAAERHGLSDLVH